MAVQSQRLDFPRALQGVPESAEMEVVTSHTVPSTSGTTFSQQCFVVLRVEGLSSLEDLSRRHLMGSGVVMTDTF